MIHSDKCGLGVCYTEMDARLALAAHILAGTTVQARVWECLRCGCWHFGKPKRPKIKGCLSTHKVAFRTREDADAELELIKRKRDNGTETRLEDRAYQCGKHWHLTSSPPIPPDAEMQA